MITVVNTCNVNTGDTVNEYVGKSTDEKPVEAVPNASVFYEMDTGAFFMFDQDTKTWLPQ